MITTNNNSRNARNDIVIYQATDGEISFNVNIFDETVWLTQKQMAELFGKSVKTISEHIKNCFKEGEVNQNSTIRNFQIVQIENNRRVERRLEH